MNIALTTPAVAQSIATLLAIQVDVKFLTFKDKSGAAIKRYQYAAIDDATRIRALKIYDRHNQANAIDFVDHVIEKFPFRIQMIRTDRGHEFQAKFHWHVDDLVVRHADYYNKARTHLSLGKDAPITRSIERYGRIAAEPLVGGLHHRHARI